ncbi:hypothetical protein L204_101329 [Cryptococcus depauperatus]
MFGPLGYLSRVARLALVVAIVVLGPTLYFFYPTPERFPLLGEWQAGGIDSKHWREPIKPDFAELENEKGRSWGDEIVMGNEGEAMDNVVEGGAIMSKLENATAKAELGRSAWKVLHLMTLRYPDEPTEDDRRTLKSFFHLFSRLYPCGECAQEFQKLLKTYPPQTSSRKSASLWLCYVHNLVNARLGKPEFDCLTLDSAYDCGCGDNSATTASSTSVNKNKEHDDSTDLPQASAIYVVPHENGADRDRYQAAEIESLLVEDDTEGHALPVKKEEPDVHEQAKAPE